MQDTLRSAWVEINLDNLAFNIQKVREKVGPEKTVIGVVKADAYGHGAVPAAKTLLENGADALAVATLSEGIELRKAGFTCEIVILGLTASRYGTVLVEYDLTPVVASVDNAYAFSRAAAAANKFMPVYAAVDTGMGRIGFLPDQRGAEMVAKIAKLGNVNLKGVFSHFATADEADKTFAKEQIKKFDDFCKLLESIGIDPGVKTFANSGAIMEVPEGHYDAVRPGIMLYGCYPSNEVDRDALELKPVMSVKAELTQVKKVPAGTPISYGRTFVTERESFIGTVPVGYADGMPRAISGKGGRVIINGVYAPIVGRVCMDQFLVDVTDVPDVFAGDEVIIVGTDGENTILAEEIGALADTISYEICCGFGQRLPKVYTDNEEDEWDF
ncbi:MAG: alanine racemase [Clostridiales bacterium]|nr:alanine racemase [Clostridiales bacterium]